MTAAREPPAQPADIPRGRGGRRQRPVRGDQGAVRGVVHRRAGHDPRDHRAQRRRQVDDVQRPVRGLQGRRGAGPLRRRPAGPHAPLPDRRHRGGARVPEHRAVGHPVRGREPHARPPPPDQGRVRRRRSPAPAGHPRGQAARRARRGDRGVPRARRQAAHARRRPLLRRPEAGGGRAGAVHRAAAAPARRTGRRHERRGDLPHGRGDPRDPVGLGITVVLVEHDMGMVMALADRVTVLDFGRRIADGTPAEVQSNPEVIRAYLGSGDEIDPAEAAPRPPTAPPRLPGRPRDPVPLAAAQRHLARGDLRAHRARLRDHLQGERGRQLHAGLAAAARRATRSPGCPIRSASGSRPWSASRSPRSPRFSSSG